MSKKMIAIVLVDLIVIIGCICVYLTHRNDNVVGNVKELSEVYFEIFKDLYKQSESLNGHYIALDLSKVKMEEHTKIIELMEKYCKDNNKELLLGTSKQMEEEGYIKNSKFEDGSLIVFEDTKLTKNLLKTKASKWAGNLGAVGAEYTAKLKKNTWKIIKTKVWIS